MSRYVLLIRGINVGRAKRVAMSDLRALLANLGARDVRTVLNSGNAVFAADESASDIAAAIEDGLASRLGVTAKVTVVTAAELHEAVAGNPLVRSDRHPSRLHVAVLRSPSHRTALDLLEGEDWTPEALAVGARVAYLWCPHGVIRSPLVAALSRVLDDGVTMRNWATMSRLDALATPPP